MFDLKDLIAGIVLLIFFIVFLIGIVFILGNVITLIIYTYDSGLKAVIDIVWCGKSGCT